MTKTIAYCLLLGSLVFSSRALACQDMVRNENISVENISSYDTIVVARITEADSDKISSWGGTLEFRASIKESIKGSLRAGDTIVGIPVREFLGGACPISLVINDIYLLLLTKSGESYSLSFWSFPTSSRHRYFSDYVRQVKAIVADG